MALLLLLLLRTLLLGAGLGPASAQEFRLRDVVRGNYDMAKVSGTWDAISMASDDVKRIGGDGDLRGYIRDIHNLDNGGLKFRFFFSVQGGCEPVDIVCEKTDKVGVHTLAYGGDNRVLVAETDYHLYVTFHLHNVRNGSATQVLALYGRIPELSAGFLDRFAAVCRRHGLGPRNIVTLTRDDACARK